MNAVISDNNNNASAVELGKQSQSAEDVEEATPSAPATTTESLAEVVVVASQSRHHDLDPAPHGRSSSTAIPTVATIIHHQPQVRPCSLNPSAWSKQRLRIASCGCLCSAMVCTIRLLLDPGPSAYIIHSIIILFDMILIHVFTHTRWLSIAGEVTAIIFATCFHFTNETIFELLETTLIAGLVSFHMIKSRNEHWDREENLERDIIGLQFFIEHPDCDGNGNGNGNGDANDAVEETRLNAIARRQSNLSVISDIEASRRSATTKDLKLDETNISSADADSSKTWWHHFFDHFLDGSAGVMYTSFLGLIIDEIVNYGSSSK